MRTCPSRLALLKGIRFFKLMGCGQGLVFSLLPDVSRYALLAVWESERAADDFFSSSGIFSDYQERCKEIWSAKLLPFKAHGLWDGQNPFNPLHPDPAPEGPLAILTRASIRTRSLLAFWKNAPQTQQALSKAEGLIRSIGVGELPFVRQATFSLWESAKSMQQYAYQSKEHRAVIQKTRSENWYKEELFARFHLLSSTGAWKGSPPLQNQTPPLQKL
jgi:heme-degrading monooxygenase HmoA